MANWTVSTLYGRLDELTAEYGITDQDSVGKLRDVLKEAIVEEALAGKMRKRPGQVKGQTKLSSVEGA